MKKIETVNKSVLYILCIRSNFRNKVKVFVIKVGTDSMVSRSLVVRFVVINKRRGCNNARSEQVNYGVIPCLPKSFCSSIK